MHRSRSIAMPAHRYKLPFLSVKPRPFQITAYLVAAELSITGIFLDARCGTNKLNFVGPVIMISCCIVMNNRMDSYKKSVRAFAEARRFIPGGVNSPVRAFGGMDLPPLFIRSASGSKIYDIDGNAYIDYVCSWGAVILGHAHQQVLKAVRAALKRGTSFGAPTLSETMLAEKITSAVKSVEKVRLVNSGTEAVMTAVRLARGYTGRDLIVKMSGGHHGHSDGLLVYAGSGLADGAVASSVGVPAQVAGLTIVVPYNDAEAAKAAFELHPGRIAAVLVEPVAANMGVVLPVDGYLPALRSLCDQNDALLIFDEVITGFRLAAGGAGELFGVKADLTCLGKVMGGGFPAAAVAGRADIMDILSPAGPVYQAGTLSGNPVATAAANATLDILLNDKDCFRRLDTAGALLEEGLTSAAKASGVDITVNRIGSIMSCFFTDKPVRNFADVQSTSVKHFKKFFAEMLRQGVYLAPSAYEAMFISLSHTPDDIARTAEAAEKSFRLLVDN